MLEVEPAVGAMVARVDTLPVLEAESAVGAIFTLVEVLEVTVTEDPEFDSVTNESPMEAVLVAAGKADAAPVAPVEDRTQLAEGPSRFCFRAAPLIQQQS